MVEQGFCKAQVASSNLVRGSHKIIIMALESWFPTTIFYEDLAPPDEVHDDMLRYVDEFYDEHKDKLKEPDNINITGDVHNDFLVHNNPVFYWLNQQISDACGIYLAAMGADISYLSVYAQKSWPVVCRRNNGSVGSHTHKNSILSAVYYLKSDDNGSGRLFFNNPTALLDDLALTFPNKSELNFTQCHYTPVEKRLIIFPSNLEHSVEDYNGVQNRYSISYDLTVVAKQDSEKDNEFLITDPSLWGQLA